MRCDDGVRSVGRSVLCSLITCCLAATFAAVPRAALWAQQEVVEETISSAPATPRYLHAEKLPAGAVLNASLEIGTVVDPRCMSQVGDHVYYDADEDGVPEIIIARAHHDGQGRIVAGAPPEGLVADYDLRYGPDDKERIVASLRALAGLHAEGELERPGYLQRQAQTLAGLRPESLGVEEGLIFLADLWDAGLIDAVLYGVKRHEMLDAIVAASQ